MSLSSTRAIFADPIHGLIDLGYEPDFAGALVQIIDTPEFQRMRRISQLGLASHVFPGATHTRFLHSLGAAHLAAKVLDHLVHTSSPSVQDELRQYRRAVIIAALLHDLGHGPFSHAFERVKTDAKGKPCVSHEQWGIALIENRLAEALRLAQVAPALVSDMLTKDGLNGRLPHYVRQIVSSQLDVDRLDYLPRDAHFAGVSLGRIDVEYIIKSLAVICTGTNSHLGIGWKGVRPYEAFALARHHMNRSVYYHPKVRVLEFMAAHFMKLAIDASDDVVPEYLRNLKSWDGARASTDTFISMNLDAYASVTETEIWYMVTHFAIHGSALAKRLAEDLLRRRVLPYSFIKRGMSEFVGAELRRSGFDRDFAIVPADSVVYKKQSAQVLVLGRDEEIRPIHDASPTIAFHMDRPEGDDILVFLERDKKLAMEQSIRRLLDAPASRPIGGLRSSRPPLAPESLREVSTRSEPNNDVLNEAETSAPKKLG